MGTQAQRRDIARRGHHEKLLSRRSGSRCFDGDQRSLNQSVEGMRFYIFDSDSGCAVTDGQVAAWVSPQTN